MNVKLVFAKSDGEMLPSSILFIAMAAYGYSAVKVSELDHSFDNPVNAQPPLELKYNPETL